ncbi:MAG: hypothetical protein ACUVRA_08355 [Candidatus Bathyarchaeaceae archaeon]
MEGVEDLEKIISIKPWDEFKKLATALHPNSVTYFLQRAPLSKPPIALRIFFTSENVLYVFLDSAKGDAFRQTKIPIKQGETQRYILHHDIKEFITKEFGRPDLVVISPMESPARYLTSLFIHKRKRLVRDRDVARDTLEIKEGDRVRVKISKEAALK